MPKILLEVPDTEASTARPVTLEIIRQVMKSTGIDKNTTIYYPSEEGEEAQLGSRINDDGEKNKFTSTTKVMVDIEEEYIADRILTTAVYQPENKFIFLDHKLNTYIKPSYSSTEVTINFRYTAANKVLARRWRDDIRNRVSMMRDVSVHTADYHFLIPPEMIYILREIHRLREAQAGYAEDFDTYFKNHSTQRLSLLTNLAGSKEAWSIAETQQRIQGWFDFESAPEMGDKENDTSAWTISFSYKFRYDKALACVMMYPLMVHNQTLSKKYRDTKSPYELEDHQRSYSSSVWHLAHFEKNPIDPPNLQVTGLGIPEIDDFIPSQVLPSSIRVLTTLIKLSQEDKKTLIDFNQLGKFKLLDRFMKFLKESEAPYVCKPYESIIHVTVYRGYNIVPHKFINVSNNAVVSCIDDLNLRDCHHVRLSLISDLTLLSKEALDRLRNNADIFKLILSIIKPNLDFKFSEDDYVTRKELEQIIHNSIYDQIYQFNTVMSLYVKAERLETT